MVSPRYRQVLVSQWTLPEMGLATFTSLTSSTTGCVSLIVMESFTRQPEMVARHLAVRDCQLSRPHWESHLGAQSVRTVRSTFRSDRRMLSCGYRLLLLSAIRRHSWVRTFRHYRRRLTIPAVFILRRREISHGPRVATYVIATRVITLLSIIWVRSHWTALAILEL